MREEEIRSASSGSKIDLDGSRRHGKKDAGEGQGGREGREEGRKGGSDLTVVLASCCFLHVRSCPAHSRSLGRQV